MMVFSFPPQTFQPQNHFGNIATYIPEVSQVFLVWDKFLSGKTFINSEVQITLPNFNNFPLKSNQNPNRKQTGSSFQPPTMETQG